MFNQSRIISPRKTKIKAPTSKLLQLDNISVNFSGIQALNTIQMDVKQGEILFITGSSGAGKTTLLRVISGDLMPSTGRVVNFRPDTYMANVFQNLRLIGKYTCETNMMMAYDSSVYKNKNEFIHDMMEFSRVLGIKNRLGLKISDANGGLKQKVAILRALLTKPDVVLFDEPTSSLDYENASKLFELLNLYNIKRGLTVIWASHNRDLIRNFSGRIVHLDNGRLVHAGHACFI